MHVVRVAFKSTTVVKYVGVGGLSFVDRAEEADKHRTDHVYLEYKKKFDGRATVTKVWVTDIDLCVYNLTKI